MMGNGSTLRCNKIYGLYKLCTLSAIVRRLVVLNRVTAVGLLVNDTKYIKKPLKSADGDGKEAGRSIYIL